MKTKLRKWLLLPGIVALLLTSASVLADEHKRKKPPVGIQAPPATKLMPDNRVSVSNGRAASLVKQRYNTSRILGVSLMKKGGSPIYKVRTLSPDGVVKSVFVDGRTGEVFE